ARKDEYGLPGAPRRSAKEPWTTRRTLTVFALLLGGLVLAWYLFFPQEFRFAVDTVRGWWASAEAPAGEEETGTAPINPATPPGPAPQGMVWIPGGTFWMGTEDGELFPDAQPRHLVYVDGFWMDKTEVTNAQFAQFVKETGYVTVAERPPDPKGFPQLRP